MRERVYHDVLAQIHEMVQHGFVGQVRLRLCETAQCWMAYPKTVEDTPRSPMPRVPYLSSS